MSNVLCRVYETRYEVYRTRCRGVEFTKHDAVAILLTDLLRSRSTIAAAIYVCSAFHVCIKKSGLSGESAVLDVFIPCIVIAL